MKKLLVLFGIAGVAMLAWAASPRFPIKFGFLQGDFDANQQSITNALNLVGTHWGDGLHLSNVTATASGAAAGVLSGTYPNPGFGSFSSATLATALSDENGGGPALFSTGDGGGLTKLNGLAITNWPTVSLMGNPTGGSASVVPITLDSTLSFVAGQLHAIGGGSGPSAGSNTFVTGTKVDLNNAMTNIQSIGFNGGGQIQGSSGATASGAFNRIAAGTTNGFMNTWNIIDFGASPALADNSTAIQNALNAASTNGGTVFVPDATNAYTCTSTIVVPNRVRLLGEGTASTGTGSQIFNSSSGIIVKLGDGGDNMIDHMLIQGGSPTGTQIGISTSGNVANNTRNYAIMNTAVKNCGIGIYLSNSWDGLLFNDYVSSCNISGQTTNYANAIRVIDGHYGGGIIGWDICGQVGPAEYNLNFQTTIEACSNAFRLNGANWANVNVSGGDYSEGSTNFVVAGAGKNLNIDHTAFTQTAGTVTTNIVLRGTSQVSMDHCYFFNSVAFDADSATFGLSFDKNYAESGVTWNNRATTSTIDDNTNIIHTGKSIYGPSANFGSLVLTNLPGTSAARMLGVDSSGNVVTNPVPGGGSGVTSFNTRSGAVTFAPPTDFPNALTNTDNGRTGGAVLNEPMTVTNAMSGYMILPTGTNITIIAWGTNSAGAILTNKWVMNPGSIGGGYNLEVMNTNNVDTFTITQDGWITFGTNKLAQISTNGIGSFQGVTNLALTASSITGTDVNKNSVSISNAHGVLTNTASGPASFGLLQNGELANSAITINGTSTALGGTASSNAGGLTNVNGQSLTGMVQSIQWDASAFMTNGSYNSNAITYVTPSAGSGGLQGSAPFYLLYPFTPNVAGTAVACTNQFFVQTYMPPEWNSNAVNFSVDVLLATNGPLTATSMVFSVAASWNGSALTTPVTVTNNVPLGVGFLSTNFIVGAIPTSGTITPNESVVFQVQYWSVGNGKITNNAWGLGARCALTNSPVQNGLVTQR